MPAQGSAHLAESYGLGLQPPQPPWDAGMDPALPHYGNSGKMAPLHRVKTGLRFKSALGPPKIMEKRRVSGVLDEFFSLWFVWCVDFF